MVDAQLTKDELNEMKEAFAMFDKDNSGFITLAELESVMTSLGQKPTDDELKDMIKEADFDGNGCIDFPEFVQLIHRQSKLVDEKDELKEAFRIFDRDGDGYITAPELQNVMQALGESMTDADIADVMALADGNGDGKVDYEEFCRILQQKKPEAATST